MARAAEQQDDDEHSEPTDGLLTCEFLAKLLGFKLSTVKRYSTQWPNKLPPRVAWSSTPLYDPQVTARWMHERDGSLSLDEQMRKAREAVEQKKRADAMERPPRNKGGRPRGSHKAP